MRSWFRLAALLAISPSVGVGQDLAQPASGAHPSFWQAAGGVLAANGLTWGYNWYVQRWPWANVGTRSWATNIGDGFVWDNDCFVDNQLAHPYHGSFYLGSARASGYGFWSSVPFVAAGSASWELFFENVRPSINDFVNTTLGGVALGEVTFRLSSLLLSRQSRGGEGVGRQAAGFALSPLARAQALLLAPSGALEAAAQQPATHVTNVAIGRLLDRNEPLGEEAGRGFVQLAVEYGSPFDKGSFRPYDAFEFHIQLSRGPGAAVNRLGVSGLLARREIQQAPRKQVILGLFQHYDYVDAPAFEFGGQSLSGAWLYRRNLGSRVQVDVGAHLETLLLGAISSDHGNYFRRDYDYGPGGGGRLSASLRRDGRELIHLEQRVIWLHSLHGAQADHMITQALLGAALPLGRLIQLGGDISLMTRSSWYRGFTPNTRNASQLRTYLVLSPS